MKTNFFKRNYKEPNIYASEKEWRDFLNKAGYEKIRQIYNENRVNAGFGDRNRNLGIILEKLGEGNWPKVSNRFVKMHKDEIFRVKNSDTAMHEVSEKYKETEPKYLIDETNQIPQQTEIETNQILGIVIDKDTIIKGIVSEEVTRELVLSINCYWLLGETMSRIASKAININKLLKEIEVQPIGNRYWISDDFSTVIWFGSGYSRPPLDDNETAGLLFLL